MYKNRYFDRRETTVSSTLNVEVTNVYRIMYYTRVEDENLTQPSLRCTTEKFNRFSCLMGT